MRFSGELRTADTTTAYSAHGGPVLGTLLDTQVKRGTFRKRSERRGADHEKERTVEAAKGRDVLCGRRNRMDHHDQSCQGIKRTHTQCESDESIFGILPSLESTIPAVTHL